MFHVYGLIDNLDINMENHDVRNKLDYVHGMVTGIKERWHINNKERHI